VPLRLVGSEMCIRDRAGADGILTYFAPHAAKLMKG
jgi:delta-aminolevulinic acid dehydratase/porphobilinogen synthase